MHQVMFVLYWADVRNGHCNTDLHSVMRCVEHRSPATYGILDRLADFVAPMAKVGVVHHQNTVVKFIYQVLWSVRKIHTLPPSGKWLYLPFHWPYYRLADLAAFHAHAVDKLQLTAANKWVCFGGSYPGNLAAWFKIKVWFQTGNKFFPHTNRPYSIREW